MQNGDRVDRTFGLDAIITGERVLSTVSYERLFLYITLGSRNRLSDTDSLQIRKAARNVEEICTWLRGKLSTGRNGMEMPKEGL